MVEDREFNERDTYVVVVTTEGDPTVNRISNESPVGAAIVGQKVGAEVNVPTPAGGLFYKIIAIE